MIFDSVSAPWWDDRPVFVIGGGPSLAGYDLSGLMNRGWVLGINKVPALVPCHAGFTLDQLFLKNSRDLVQDQADFGVEYYAGVGADHPDPRIQGVRYVERIQGVGLSKNPAAVVNGLNSGYGALNLAVLKRAREIYLLGYDMHKPGHDRPPHWHGGYPWYTGSSEIYFGRWAARFDEAKRDLPAGVRVVNANPRSAVRCFAFTSYEELGLCQVHGLS